MTEENYGKVWELDHIIPVDYFDLENEEDLRLCYSRYNIIPMYKKHNKAKGASVHFSSEVIDHRIFKGVEEDMDVLLTLRKRIREAIREWNIYFK